MADKNVSTEYTGVYTGIFPNMSPREIELEARVKELKEENEELNNRMAEVTYRATGGRLSYSNYTLDAIGKAFNDQLEILSDQKVEEETKELNQKLYLAQNEIRSKTEYIQEQRDIIKKLEQECEELKKELNGSEKWRIKAESLNEKLSIEKYRYRKALEEIEGYVRDNSDFDKSDILTSKTGAYDILDIINKAKGEE